MKNILFLILLLLILGCKPMVDRNIKNDETTNKAATQIDALIQKSVHRFNSNANTDSLLDNILIEAIDICDSYALDTKKAEIYIMVGKRYRNISNYGYAISYYQKAQDIAIEINDDRIKAYTTHEMAVAFRRIDDNAQALLLHFKALEWAESAKDTFLIHSSLNGVGNIYFSYNNIPDAIKYFHKSLSFLGTPRNLLGEAINTHNIGEAWLILEEPDSAFYYIEKSYELNLKIESLIGQAICKNGMGKVHIQLGKYSKAIGYFKESLALNRKLGDLIYVAYNLRNLGEAYLKLKQYKKAENSLLEALEISKEIGSKSEALETLKSLSQLYQETKKLNVSVSFLKDAMVYKDSITKEVSEQNTKAMHVLFKSEKQAREILILKQNNQLNELKLSRQKHISFGIILLIVVGIVMVIIVLRQRKLTSKYNEIELEQKLMRAQLNPHFIFNSLSAIQNFIMQNDKIAAFDYLANFSRLIRNILMGSRTESITLDNEIIMLKDYLTLQQLRFQNIFTYELIVDPNIDSEICLLPPMLTQPIIENAIEHGLRPLKSDGILKIRYIKDQNNLIIEVEDNGAGLKQSAQNKIKNDHVSLATIITKKRLENMQHISHCDCNFEIIEKENKSNDSGVIAKLTIPYREEQE